MWSLQMLINVKGSIEQILFLAAHTHDSTRSFLDLLSYAVHG